MIDKNDPRLTAFVLDELDADQRLEIQAAIETSPDLQTEVAEIRRTVGLLGDMFDAEPALALTDLQREVLHEEMNAGRSEVAKRSAQIRRRREPRQNTYPSGCCGSQPASAAC